MHMQGVLWTPERSRERGSIDTREIGGLTTSGGAEGSQGPHASALHAEKPPVWLLCAVWMSQGACRGRTEPVTGRECSSQLSVETSCVTNRPNTQWLRTAIIYAHRPEGQQRLGGPRLGLAGGALIRTSLVIPLRQWASQARSICGDSRR